MQNLTPGSYFGQLIDAQLSEVGTNGNIAMVLIWDINNQAVNGQWQAIDTATRQENFFLSDKAKDRSFSDMKKLGFNGDFDNPHFSQECYDGIELVVENELYNGKVYDRVKPAKLVVDVGIKAAGKDKARLFAAQYRTAMGAASRPTTPPPIAPSGMPAAIPEGTKPPAEVAFDESKLPF